MFIETLTFFLVAFSALFFVVDPIGLSPIFLALTSNYPEAKRQKAARKACWIFVGVVGFFAVGGGIIFDLLGVSLAAFKVAGGLLLLFTALDMLRSKQSETRTSDEEIDAASRKEDIAIVPLGMPLLAGPGAIATSMVLTSRATGPFQIGLVVVAILILGVLTYLFLRAAPMVERVLGKNGLPILERVMGLLLAAIAIQFMIDGLGEALPGLLEGGGA